MLTKHTACFLSHKMGLKWDCLVKDGPQTPESVLCSQQKSTLDHICGEPPMPVRGRLRQAPTLVVSITAHSLHLAASVGDRREDYFGG